MIAVMVKRGTIETSSDRSNNFGSDGSATEWS